MRFRSLLVIICFLFSAALSGATPKSMVLVVPSYNNVLWFPKNLSSLLMQKYPHFRIIYINDSSKDGTGPCVDAFVKDQVKDFQIIYFDDTHLHSIDERTDTFCKLVNEERHFFTVVHNVNRCGALENLYRAIQSTEDDEVIVTVDGDDWLSRSDVLKELNQIYSKQNVWLTHGCMKEYPSGNVSWSIPIPDHIVKENDFRTYRCPSHLRTFYSWLFKKIELEDLLYNGQFFPMTWDMAMMYPMIEMAGERHAFIKKPNYIYNQANIINDNKVNAQLQRDLDALIRAKKRYQRLE